MSDSAEGFVNSDVDFPPLRSLWPDVFCLLQNLCPLPAVVDTVHLHQMIGQFFYCSGARATGQRAKIAFAVPLKVGCVKKCYKNGLQFSTVVSY